MAAALAATHLLLVFDRTVEEFDSSSDGVAVLEDNVVVAAAAYEVVVVASAVAVVVVPIPFDGLLRDNPHSAVVL